MTDPNVENVEANIDQDLPIINCHIHSFTQHHVPPWLGKTVLPFPFYLLTHLPSFLFLFKRYHAIKNQLKFATPWYSSLLTFIYTVRILFFRYFFLSILRVLFIVYVLATLIPIVWPVEAISVMWIKGAYKLMNSSGYLLELSSAWQKIGAFLFALILIPSIRQIIFLLAKQIKAIGWAIPSQQSKELLKRYLNMARYNTYKKQSKVLERVFNQYPEKTQFVVLPMDMAFMEAGDTSETYEEQMNQIIKLKSEKKYKDILLPFVFIDPRRERVGKRPFFKYEITNDKFSIQSCYIKDCFESYGIAGIKIYPSLGYYPFDPRLLPIWIYAAEKGIPIMTHCTKGTIYYRGSKKSEWDYHPILNQNDNDKLLLGQVKNAEFCNNFIHPLNYVCLLEERLLRRVVSYATNDVKKYFGYVDDNTDLKRDLYNLKICVAHYGGSGEWNKYLQLDRDNYSKDIVTKPNRGIEFLKNRDGNFSEIKLSQLWSETDWYSIITSMLLQYDNVYADISYILHDKEIYPLLNETLSPARPKLRSRVLFGTDFFVVRNQKSDKELFIDLIDSIGEDDFNQIARVNPQSYLTVNYNQL